MLSAIFNHTSFVLVSVSKQLLLFLFPN